MPTFTKVTTLDEAQRLTSPAVMREHWRIASVKTQEYYLESLISEHFMKRSPNHQYTPNKVAYEVWKRRYYPQAIYQLVLSGRLQRAAENGRVQRDGTIVFDLPEYGLYQIQAGRDFLELTREDKRKMAKRFTKEFFDVRKRYANA